MNTQSGGSPSAWTYVPGIGVAALIAGVSFLLAMGHVALDPLVLSMLISIIIGNLAGSSGRLAPGISLAQRVFIPAGIVLYGTQMQLQPLRLFGPSSIAYFLFMVASALAAIFFITRRLALSKKLSMLIAAGSAICGASAIVVLSPVIRAEKEDTSVSLLAITVVGLAGVILYPLLQEALALSERVYGLLCGSTLYQVGQVKAAAALIGQPSLAIAVPVKLIRVATLLPVAILYSLIAGGGTHRPFVPWFIVGSMAMAVIVNIVPGLQPAAAATGPYATFLFSTAIAAIGLSVDLETIIDAGPRPFLAVFLGWLVLITLFTIGVRLLL